MSISLFLQGAKVVSDIFKGQKANKYAKKLANEQKKTNGMYYQYNREQLEKTYESAFANNMNIYINNRLNIANEYSDVKTQLNIEASKSSVNLNDSSFNNDAQSELDMEFNRNLQDTYTNLVNRTAELVINKTSTDMTLNQQYMNQINNIDNSVKQVQNAMWNQIEESAMNLGTNLIDDYRGYSTKQEKAGKDGSFKDYLQTDLLNFKL